MREQRFETVKLQVADRVLHLAAETRKAYFEAVAAQQGVVYAQQVNAAAEAGATLASRMARVGNWSKLDQSREQVFYAEAAAELELFLKYNPKARDDEKIKQTIENLKQKAKTQ